MIVAQVDRTTPVVADATGAAIGSWIDGNFPFAVAIAVVAGLALLGLLWVAVRSRLRYRREAKRLRRTYETGIDRRLDELGGRIDRVRDEVRQLGELGDHTVAELRRLREHLGETAVLASSGAMRRERPAVPADETPSAIVLPATDAPRPPQAPSAPPSAQIDAPTAASSLRR